jgi:hypothetical protein
VNVGSTGRTNLIDTGVKQCSQISSAVDILYQVVSHQNDSLPLTCCWPATSVSHLSLAVFCGLQQASATCRNEWNWTED